MELEKKCYHVEGTLAIQKAVTDGLESDWKRLQKQINKLEADLEDHRQYSRRTNILIHGLEEEAQEVTDNKVLQIFHNQLNLPEITENEVSRSHWLGPKRPIIVRFPSYRHKKMVFNANKIWRYLE